MQDPAIKHAMARIDGLVKRCKVLEAELEATRATLANLERAVADAETCRNLKRRIDELEARARARARDKEA